MNEIANTIKPKALPTTGLAFLLILSALMAFTSLSTDIYLPAMPSMEKELQGDIELTITSFLIGFAIAQLIWGPMSDQIGRKRPLFIGMILFSIGSIGCALSTSIEQIVFWRTFQALGACTGPMLARAIIRDLFAKTRAAQMLSTLTIIMAIAPIAGPLLGGQIIKFSNWHSIFWFLAMIGSFMFVSLNWLPETLPEQKRKSSSLTSRFSNYVLLVKNWDFMRYTLCVTFYYVGVYAFVAGSPFVYIDYYGISSQHYGWLFALNIVGVMAMSMVNKKLVTRYELHNILRFATCVAATAMVMMAVLVWNEVGGAYSIIISLLIFFSMNGIIAATSTAAALDKIEPSIVGSASAVIGSLQYGSGIISTLLLALLSNGTPWTMAWIMLLFILASAATVFVGGK